ncbi:Chaperone protein dnaJ 11 chloroplastic [Bienertia sinuspersici]
MLSFSLSSPSPPHSSFTSVQLPLSPLKFRRPSAVSATASPETAATPSLYDVLGVSAAATTDEIKAAYRRLARSCHPDVTVGGERKPADVFMRVHAAYSVLSDPDKRADYDRKLSRILRPPREVFPGLSASPTSSFCRFPRRNWETDQCW